MGIGTLYRHFPDRRRSCAPWCSTCSTGRSNRVKLHCSSRRPGEALRRYLHAAIDTGLGVVNVVHGLLDDTAWPDRRVAAQDLLDRLVGAARSDGAIGDDVTATDVAFATIRFCRPLAIGLDPADERAIAHRQLGTYLDGLIKNDH